MNIWIIHSEINELSFTFGLTGVIGMMKPVFDIRGF